MLTTALEPMPTGEQVIEGVRVVRLRAWPADFDLYFAPAVYSWIRHRKWDIVHCQGYHTFVAPAAMAALIAAHQRFVVTFHSGGHSSMVRRCIATAAAAAAAADAETCRSTDRGVRSSRPTSSVGDFACLRRQFATITNGVSPDFLDVHAESEGTQSIICSVGRLERYKGHHRVIEALPALRKLVPDVVLYIVGDGPYRQRLETLARQLGVRDIVEFISIDPTERRQMAELFRSAQLVTLLSDYESQGVVGLEAIAVGTAVARCRWHRAGRTRPFRRGQRGPAGGRQANVGGTHRPQAAREPFAAARPRSAVGEHRR